MNDNMDSTTNKFLSNTEKERESIALTCSDSVFNVNENMPLYRTREIV